MTRRYEVKAGEPLSVTARIMVTVQLGARNMAGSDWTVAPNQTMLCDDVARPQYHKARLGTHSSGGAHSFAVASAARAVTADSLHRV